MITAVLARQFWAILKKINRSITTARSITEHTAIGKNVTHAGIKSKIESNEPIKHLLYKYS